MKILFEDYSFDAAAQTVAFNTTDVITLEQLLIITNVTTNKIIYNFADPNAGGTIVNNVLTLDFNTTSMSSSDKLQIFIDNILTPASDETLQLVGEQNELMRRMVKLLEPSSRASSAGLQMVDASFTTITATNQHNLTFLGGAQNSTITAAEAMFFPQSRQSYALIRQNLIFS
jgi:hypothetical protein